MGSALHCLKRPFDWDPFVEYKPYNKCGITGKVVNDEITIKLNSSRHKNREIRKILLIGSKDSGRSTLFRQLIYLFGDEKDLIKIEKNANIIPWIHNFIISGLKNLLKYYIIIHR